mmetsp:Transcript_2939/g.2521  ORF Transcript_2939/g.2521 Transcript_2939/m.2521 type:complete len:211 (+) Transcript_2939:58-690(+)
MSNNDYVDPMGGNNPNANAQGNVNINVNPDGQGNQAQPQGRYQGKLAQKLGLDKAANPGICLLHLLFKSLSIALFWICAYIVYDWESSFLSAVLCSVADFFVVKYKSGPVLIGLKWTFGKKDEKWQFDGEVVEEEVNSVDKVFFWYPQIGVGAYWFAYFIWNLMTIDWIWGFIQLVCTFLYGLNAYGYYKASDEAQEKVKLLGNAANTLS